MVNDSFILNMKMKLLLEGRFTQEFLSKVFAGIYFRCLHNSKLRLFAFSEGLLAKKMDEGKQAALYLIHLEFFSGLSPKLKSDAFKGFMLRTRLEAFMLLSFSLPTDSEQIRLLIP